MRGSPLTSEEDRSLLGHIQPFCFVFENLAYRATLDAKAAGDLLLLDIGMIAVINANLLPIEVVQPLLSVLLAGSLGDEAEWHWRVLLRRCRS